ncbi:Multidrug resistance protein ABC transporter family protein [Heracleum sosnowskyi]|uniref:Multidrug resistance protein ABC transporter family protein n=1 Tax=Heracleum sosnowskyi TaxID=360622 RepID=A0AAD8IFM1_9APIA|nr:Multidrug resistance protein ABC transporter family protein [Heracleum sosnowskyi]
MGNKITSNHRSLPATGKVILSDGNVHVYDAPLTVAELMLEYQHQVVVEFKSASTGKKPSPLPADEKLDRRKLYIMLPVKKGKPASLTSLESQQLLLRANNVLRSPSFFSSTTGVLPFFVKICPASRKWVADKNGHAAKRREELEGKNSLEKEDYFEKMLEMGSEFMTRQVSGKGWKPSLDTIVEKGVKPKVRHWLS